MLSYRYTKYIYKYLKNTIEKDLGFHKAVRIKAIPEFTSLYMIHFIHRLRNDNKTRPKTKKKGGENMQLLTQEIKQKLPALYSQENENDPLVVCKFFDPTGSWTWYAYEGSPVDENGYFDTDKPKVDFLFFGLVVGF